MQQISEICAHFAAIRDQSFLLDDLLHCIGSGARDGMTMVRLKMHECLGAFGQDVYDLLTYHQSANGLIACSEAFGYRLEMRDNTLLLPCV